MHGRALEMGRDRMFEYPEEYLSWGGPPREPRPPDRQSPTGVWEYFQDELSGNNVGHTLPFSGRPTIHYKKGWENSPHVINHERLHAGQMQVRRHPSLEQLKEIFPYNSAIPNDQLEIPAYDLDITRPTPQVHQRFRKYLDAIRKLNGPSTVYLEANSPDELMAEYLRTQPYPYPDPPQPKGLSDTPISIMRALQRRK